MALYQREGWEPIGHGPDTPDARPGLVLTTPDPVQLGRRSAVRQWAPPPYIGGGALPA